MKVEFRLKKILEKERLYRHGVAGEIAKYCKVDRQTIGRIMRNQVRSISLDLLGKISDWIEKEKGIREPNLPQALLGPQPAQLWEAITQSRRTIICLGQFEHSGAAEPARYIARCDACVESQIVKFLSQTYPVLLQLETRYVPFRVGPDRDRLSMTKELAEDTQGAQEIFHSLEEQREQAAVISIGSQITNYVTESAVARLFGCEPFAPAKPPGSRVPVYVVYRHRDHAVRSCFGGLNPPAGTRGQKRCGIYYRDGHGDWCPLPWVRDKADSGIVITVYDPSHSVQPQLLILGYSGVATETIGAYVAGDHANEFWPPVGQSRGMQVGIYLCRIQLEQEQVPSTSTVSAGSTVAVIPMDAKVVNKYLR